MRRLAIYLCIAASLLFGCKDDDNQGGSIPGSNTNTSSVANPHLSGNTICSDFMGRVFDQEKNEPVEGQNPNEKATVFFLSVGQKQLLPKFAKLRVLN